MPIDIFQMDKRDLRKLERFFKESPKLIRPATAGVLNSLAFKTKKNDSYNINRMMIVRNKRFVESSIRVQMARSGPIERQIAIVGSIRRPRFTGWPEQEYGRQPTKKRAATRAARGGSKRRPMIQKARLRTNRRFYKPQQFTGRSLQQKFYFMMRVLGSRGGGEFILNENISTRRGHLGRGLYSLKGHRLRRLQVFDKSMRPRRRQWRALSLRQLKYSNDIYRIWATQINRIVNRFK